MAIGMHIYRQILYPGAWTYVWSRDGNLNPDGWIMVGPGGRFQPTQISLGLRALSYYDSAYHHALRIPAPIPTGTYDLEMDQQYTGLGLIIEDVPDTSTPYPVQPSVTSDPVDDIQTALNLGNVLLGPGRYILTRTIDVPANRTIRDCGATLVRTYENVTDPGAYPYDYPFFKFSSTGRTLVEGVTFLADRRPVNISNLAKVDLAYDLAGPTHVNITVRRCDD